MSNRYDDLVLHLNLDDIDISAGTTPDSSKSGLKAKVNGTSLVEDDTFGACLNFDEQDDHVEVSSLGLPGQNPPHTIEGWIKVKTYPEKAQSFILLLGQTDSHSHHWLLNSETAGNMGKKAQLGHWGLSSNQHATPIIPPAEWVHLAATFDGLNYVCYLNGQSIDIDDKRVSKSYEFTLTDKGLTLAGHAKLRATAQSRGIATETNFQGKMAHVRVYRRALSESEIREDMDTDKLALPIYRKGHPISFSLRDEDENDVLYIGDNPRDHHRLKFELRNTSGQAIRFQKQGDQASKDNYHFELVFRNGVLSDKTLELLRESKNEVVPKNKEEKERWENLWDLSSPGEDSQTGTVSVYFLYKGTSQLFGQNTKLVIPLRNISANAGSGARGARIELKLNQLTYDGETTRITGSQIQHLQIISHLGSRRVPLHVGFVSSNRILNDGSSANTLVLQLMNVLKSEGDTSGTYTTLTSAFTMPAVNGTAVASVASGGAAQFNVGGIVYILPIGYLNVTALNTASNQLTLQNLGYSVNQAAGSVAPSGNTLLTKDSESSITLTQESEFLISFDVQSASEDAPWSLCTEREIEGVKGSIIVAKTDGRYVVIDKNGDPVSDNGRWKVDSTGHGQGETPVWSIKPRQDIVLRHDDYIQIYISNIKTSLPSGLTNLYLDYRRIPGFWDGQVVCPIEKAPLLFYDVTAKGQTFSFPQRSDYIGRHREAFPDIPVRPYLSSEERDRLVIRLKEQRMRLLDGQLKKEADHFFNECERLADRGKRPRANIPELLAVTASRRYIQLLDEYDVGLYVSPNLGGKELPATGNEQVHHAADWQSHSATLGTRGLRIGMFRRFSHEWSLPKLKNNLGGLKLRLAADMVEIAENATEPAEDSVELAETKKSLREIAALLNEIETQPAQLQYTGELRVGIGCVKPKAKLEIALSDNDGDTKPLVIRKGEVNYLTVLQDGKVGIGTQSPQNQLHAAAAQLNVAVASQSEYAGIAIAQGNGVNVVLKADPGGGNIGTASQHRLWLVTNYTPRVVVTADGKVGIGTSTPSAKLSISGGLHVGGESDPGNNNLLVSGKASIKEGLHVGGESDPGNKNLLVSGKASIKKGLHVGGESDPGDKNLLVDGALTAEEATVRKRLTVVEGVDIFGPLTVQNSIEFLRSNIPGQAYHAALIAVESDLAESKFIFKAAVKTHGGTQWLNRVVIHTPGRDAPTLAVEGNISEKLDVIDAQNNGDWSKPGNPICDYFKTRLAGKPSGTTLRALSNKPDHQALYFEGWVNAAGDIMLSHNKNDIQVIVKKPNPTGGGGTVVYADG